jgi:hypothetical protein
MVLKGQLLLCAGAASFAGLLCLCIAYPTWRMYDASKVHSGFSSDYKYSVGLFRATKFYQPCNSDGKYKNVQTGQTGDCEYVSMPDWYDDMLKPLDGISCTDDLQKYKDDLNSERRGAQGAAAMAILGVLVLVGTAGLLGAIAFDKGVPQLGIIGIIACNVFLLLAWVILVATGATKTYTICGTKVDGSEARSWGWAFIVTVLLWVLHLGKVAGSFYVKKYENYGVTMK